MVEQVPTPKTAPEAELPCSVELNKTFIHDISDVSFGNLPKEMIFEIFKDGRPFSHFIERWLPEQNYPLVHISGCKDHDFTDLNYPVTRYDEKTFTKGGCRFCPSNMIGQGRKFDEEKFREKTVKLIFCIVSNVAFPRIKVRFVRGSELIKLYPRGEIPLKDHVKFFD